MEEAVLRRLDDARSVAQQRLRLAPSLPMLQSICAQLDYVYAVATGVSADRSRLRDVIVGVYAIREFEDSDPELAGVLKDVQFVVDRMTRGLKIFATDFSREPRPG